MKAITGGREIWGFPKHPEPATISHEYEEVDGNRDTLNFNCTHNGTDAVSLKCKLPQTDPNVVTMPVEVMEGAPDSCIGAPRLGGTHKGHNGANQIFYRASLKCTQHMAGWNPETDQLQIGENPHYAPLSRWDF